MSYEIETNGMWICIQELGVIAKAYYDKDKGTTAFIRQYGDRYELWFCADKSSQQGEKYLENYAQVDLTREQLIALRDLIERKLAKDED